MGGIGGWSEGGLNAPHPALPHAASTAAPVLPSPTSSVRATRTCPCNPPFCLRSVANKGEAFISGIPSGSKGLDAFVADIPIPAASSTTDSLAFRVKQHMGPHDMVTLQLPHEKWDESLPPILAFYSFAALERM